LQLLELRKNEKSFVVFNLFLKFWVGNCLILHPWLLAYKSYYKKHKQGVSLGASQWP